MVVYPVGDPRCEHHRVVGVRACAMASFRHPVDDRADGGLAAVTIQLTHHRYPAWLDLYLVSSAGQVIVAAESIRGGRTCLESKLKPGRARVSSDGHVFDFARTSKNLS